MTNLSCSNLSKKYNSKTVVNKVSVNLETGKVVGLLGPNGAGKTTTFYMLVGLIKCNGGEISIDDIKITDQPMHTRSKLGISYLPQEASIFKNLSVEDNILAILQMRNDLSPQQQTKKLNTLLDMLQIKQIRKSDGISLSGGERRRVEIARALANDPKFLLLDEPFAGIDPISVIELQKIIKSLTESDIGILITDHNVRETLKVCNEAYILSDGKVIAHGKPNKIISNELVQNVYLGENFKL
tara:strand:- start:2204 stop:2929 length:726 start_codon:yes stop_codon:yes gene_type:complete